MPVLCGIALKNKGVQLMLDAVVDYLPSPLDVPPVIGIESRAPTTGSRAHADDEEPFAALAFKIQSTRTSASWPTSGSTPASSSPARYVLELDARVSASASAACCRCTPTTAKTSPKSCAGDIAPIVGLKSTFTGDTLCDPDNPIVLESIVFPEPVISIVDRAEDRGRPGQDGRRAGPAGRGRPDLPRSHRTRRPARR